MFNGFEPVGLKKKFRDFKQKKNTKVVDKVHEKLEYDTTNSNFAPLLAKVHKQLLAQSSLNV